MRLATIQTSGGPRAAVLQSNHSIDLHGTDASLPKSLRQLIEGGPSALKKAELTAKRADAVRQEAGKVKFLPLIPDPPKIVCLGLNYADHAKEGGVPIPKEPILFRMRGPMSPATPSAMMFPRAIGN